MAITILITDGYRLFYNFNGTVVVSNNEYWEQSQFCAELIVEQAGYDVDKLASLAGNYDHLPSSAIFKQQLASQVKQISPDKNVNCHCTALPFTVSLKPVGFVIWC